jgi:hypothetical protein
MRSRRLLPTLPRMPSRTLSPTSPAVPLQRLPANKPSPVLPDVEPEELQAAATLTELREYQEVKTTLICLEQQLAAEG